MQEQMMAALGAKLFGGTTGNTVVNVGAAATGNPDDNIFAQDEALEREVENQLAMMGGDFDPGIEPGYGSITEHDLGDLSGLPAGNIVSDLLNRGRRATSGVINTVTGKTEQAFKRVNQELTTIKSTLSQTRRIAQANQRKLSTVSRKWDERFGEKTRFQRIALQTLVSLPGVRSLNILTTAQSVGMAGAVEAIGKAANDTYDSDRADVALSVVPAVPAAYDQTAIDGIRDALVASDEAVVARIAAIEARLDKLLKALVDAKAEDNAGSYKALLHKDLFAQVAVITPTQLADRDEALYEGVAKYVLGAAKPAGAGILSGLI